MGAPDIVAAHAMKSRSTAERETARLSDAMSILSALAWRPFVVLGAESKLDASSIDECHFDQHTAYIDGARGLMKSRSTGTVMMIAVVLMAAGLRMPWTN